MIEIKNREKASFRDPAGFIYYKDGAVYRQIKKCYFKQYRHLMNSGLYDELIKLGYLVKHRQVAETDDYITLEVEKIPFISYPYEWCFYELKDAALLTLKIQKIALKYGMILKDASAYNVQFVGKKAIFIDTLSFDFYEDNSPWGAYGQFCRHFMAPLLLMRYVDESLVCLLSNYIDGIPIELAKKILKNRGGFTAFEHIKLHSYSINKNCDNHELCNMSVSKVSLNNMIQMIIRQIEKLTRKKSSSEWEYYYENTNYSNCADESKLNIVSKYLQKIKFEKKDVIFDLGANDGKYSKLAQTTPAYVVAFDIDHNVVNRNYLASNDENKNMLPLLLDLANPSSSIGFANEERKSLSERGSIKCIMALAIIHHMCISNNVSFVEVARWFSKLGHYLIIEFVPKKDSQVCKLLATRKDIFNEYDEKHFEKEFSKYFKILQKEEIVDSKRVLYLMEVDKDE